MPEKLPLLQGTSFLQETGVIRSRGLSSIKGGNPQEDRTTVT